MRVAYFATGSVSGSAPGVRDRMFNLKTDVMEFLNRVELRGVVGKSDINAYNGNRVINFSVVTEYSTRDRDGNPGSDVTWFNVSAWENREVVEDMDAIQKGVWVELIGRLRVRRYVTQDNEERTVLEVVPRKVKVLPREDVSMQPQRDY